jgi:isoquinoline 1-oxidoreductase alpha subunit
MAFELTVNGESHSVDADPQTPLLWVIRDYLGLTGTKFSCGIAQCGACTVHVDGQPVRSCSFPASLAIGKSIKTIEGVSRDGNHPVQLAWKELDAPQCGYCQSGMIMAVSAFLATNPHPTDEQLAATVTNICRCGTYPRIRAAVHSLAAGKTAGAP